MHAQIDKRVGIIKLLPATPGDNVPLLRNNIYLSPHKSEFTNLKLSGV